jgi:hypothetical protein
MTQEGLYQMLASTGYPVAYRSFRQERKPPPYIVYLSDDPYYLFADNGNYAEALRFRVELYTGIKDCEAEKSVESAIAGAGIAYSKHESYIKQEQVFQISYEIQIIGG